MIRKISLLAFSLMTLLFVSSCKKDPAPAAAIPKFNAFEARIDNKPWKADSVSAYIFENRIIIKGFSSDGRTLTFDLDGTTAKTYKLNALTKSKVTLRDSNFTKISNYNTNVEGIYTGEVIVKTIDIDKRLISCSFQFTMVGVENGRLIDIQDGIVVDVPYFSFVAPIQRSDSSEYFGIFESGPDSALVYDTVDTKEGITSLIGERIVTEFPFARGKFKMDFAADVEIGDIGAIENETLTMELTIGSSKTTYLERVRVISHDTVSRTIRGTVNLEHEFIIYYPKPFVFAP